MYRQTIFSILLISCALGMYAQDSVKVSAADLQSLIERMMMSISQVLLYPALFCLTAGIFIGAVWANMSWGRYWGWDPKETWALITMLVYALLLHFPWMKAKLPITNVQYPIIYHVLSVIDFALVLFTYFGVSYLLGGLHSYAN